MSTPETVLARINWNKSMFVRHYTESTDSVTSICKKVGISRETFYEWRRSDPGFRKNLVQRQHYLNDEVENLLMEKIFTQKDAASIRYYLDRRHPNYNPKVKIAQSWPTDAKAISEKSFEEELGFHNM